MIDQPFVTRLQTSAVDQRRQDVDAVAVQEVVVDRVPGVRDDRRGCDCVRLVRTGAHRRGEPFVGSECDVEQPLPLGARLGADEDRPVQLSRVAPVGGGELGDDDVSALEPAGRRILRREAAGRVVHRHRAEEGDVRLAAVPSVGVVGKRDELELCHPGTRAVTHREHRKVAELCSAAQPVNLLVGLDEAQALELARDVHQLGDAPVELLPVGVRHTHRERRVDADEPDALRAAETLRHLLCRPIAAPLDDRHVARLARVRHVVRQADEQRGFSLARQDEVAVMEVEVVREPEDIRLVVAVDPRVAEEHERLELVLVHQVARERVAATHIVYREAVPHQPSCSRSQSATSGRYL